MKKNCTNSHKKFFFCGCLVQLFFTASFRETSQTRRDGKSLPEWECVIEFNFVPRTTCDTIFVAKASSRASVPVSHHLDSCSAGGTKHFLLVLPLPGRHTVHSANADVSVLPLRRSALVKSNGGNATSIQDMAECGFAAAQWAGRVCCQLAPSTKIVGCGQSVGNHSQ